MKQRLTLILSSFLLLSLFTGCAGIRLSYQDLIDSEGVISLCLDESAEVLSVGGGFPGWWGMYPSAHSTDEQVFNVSCQHERSAVPFREPGVVFGGQVCRINANNLGFGSLRFRDVYLPNNEPASDVEVQVAQCTNNTQ